MSSLLDNTFADHLYTDADVPAELAEPIGPDPDDSQWLAEQNEDWHETENPDFDAMAENFADQLRAEIFGACG